MRRVRAYIGLGSNVGDAVVTLRDAVSALDSLPGARVVGVSRLYVTTPVGVTDQPDFHNAAVALDLRIDDDPVNGALDLLVALKGLERDFGRRRRRRWGPRELDLDILVFGRHRIDVERPAEGASIDPGAGGRALVIPHPEADDRLFVLAPLADLAPGLTPPGWTETVATARDRRRAVEGPRAVRPVGEWDGRGGRWSGAQVAGR